MIHAYRSSPQTTVIVSADDVAAFEQLASSLIEGPPEGGSAHRPTFSERIMDEDLERFDPEILPIIVEFDSAGSAERFTLAEGVKLVSSGRAYDHYKTMIAPVVAERRKLDKIDDRTIGEITGYDKHDPHDHRSDEEKARHAEQQEKFKQAYDKAVKDGQLSSDSFASPNSDKLNISDVKLSTDASGKKIVSIDALGTKGLHTQTSAEERQALLEDAERDATAHTDYHAPGDGEPQSRRAKDYIFAYIDTQRVGEQPFVVVAPRVQWLRDGRLDDRRLSDAIGPILPEGMRETDPGEFTRDGAGEDMIDAMLKAGFRGDRQLKDSYLKTYASDGGLLDQPGLFDAAPVPSGAPMKRKAAKGMDAESFGGARPEGDEEAPLTEYIDENGDDTLITPNKLASRYYRCTVRGMSLADADPLLKGLLGFRFDKKYFVKRDASYGCWYACISQHGAKDIDEALNKAGVACLIEEVDHRGVLREQQAAEQKAVEIPVRPWNERASVWAALTPAEKEENRKTWKGEEFLIAEEENPKGIIVHICPKTWFEKTNTFFEGEYDISHLLPATMEKIGPHSYHDTSRQDWNHLSADLELKRKFKSNLFLTIVHNLRNA